MSENYKSVSRDLENIWYELQGTGKYSITPYKGEEASCSVCLFYERNVWLAIIRDDVILEEWRGDPVYSYTRLPDAFPDISNTEFCNILNRTVAPVLRQGNRCINESESLPVLEDARRLLREVNGETPHPRSPGDSVVGRYAVTPIQGGSFWDCTLVLKQGYVGSRKVGPAYVTVEDSFAVNKHTDDTDCTDVSLPEDFPDISACRLCEILNSVPIPWRGHVDNGYREIKPEEVETLLKNVRENSAEDGIIRSGMDFEDLLDRYFGK